MFAPADFQGLGIKLKQIIVQKKLWTLRKFGEQVRKELLRNLLGQVSTTLGGFLSYKMGFRSATDPQQRAAEEEAAAAAAAAAAKEKQSSLHKMAAAMHLSRANKKAVVPTGAGAFGPIDETASDDEADGAAGGGGVAAGSAQAGSESSLLLANQLDAFPGVDEAEAAQEELHVKSLLFGAPKTAKSGGGLLSHLFEGSHKHERDRAAEKDAQLAREKAQALAAALEKQAQKEAAMHHGSSALGSSSRRSIILASGGVLSDSSAAGSPSPSAPSSVPPSPLRPAAAALGRPQTLLPNAGASPPVSLPPPTAIPLPSSSLSSPQPHSLPQQPQQQQPQLQPSSMPPAIPARPPMIPPRPSLVPSQPSQQPQQAQTASGTQPTQPPQ